MKIAFKDGTEVETVQKAIQQNTTLQFTIKANDLAAVEKMKQADNLETLTESDDNAITSTYTGYQILKGLTVRPELDGELFYITAILERNDYYNELKKLKAELDNKEKTIEQLTSKIDSTVKDCKAIMDVVDDLMCNIIPVIDETSSSETTIE